MNVKASSRRLLSSLSCSIIQQITHSYFFYSNSFFIKSFCKTNISTYKFVFCIQILFIFICQFFELFQIKFRLRNRCKRKAMLSVRLELKKGKMTNDAGKTIFNAGIPNHRFVLVLHGFMQ